jgi:methylmalonyl-CoA mutase, N-terminal domain
MMAMYQATAEKFGYSKDQISTTPQNDILKEMIGRGAWIFPVEHGVRLVGDSIEYAVKELPKSNPVSLCGYHIRESGATPAQEIAYAFAIAKAYIDNVTQRGIKPEDFVGRFSFNFNVYGNMWEQIAKFRAARKLWAKMLKEEYGVTEKKKLFLRGLFGGGGSGLTKEQPENNIMRGAYYALGAALSGAQTTALCSFDEAYTIPTPRSALLSLRTLEMLMDEVGLRDTVDPLAGSYFIETLTLEMEEKIIEEMNEVEKWGGMVKSISNGFIQRKVSAQAYEYEKGLQSGEYKKVGLNPEATENSEEKTNVELHEYNEEWAIKSKASLEEVKRTRNDKEVSLSLAALEKAAKGSDNVMPHLVKCCHAYATVGEMAEVFRDAFGEWNEPDFY